MTKGDYVMQLLGASHLNNMHIKTLLCLHDNNRSRPQPRLFSRVQNSTVEKLNVHFAGPFHTSFKEEKRLVEIDTVDSSRPCVQQILHDRGCVQPGTHISL